ncbi:30S ribosomal protein S6 [Hippea sp. KM1]|uniref:30S ribosomal protein S6 n=1 Tax=Hippea sp. KM1 TaxID=944481 RepID=UPI00046D8C72|nr:30S ribosomal protein S6 [Hippea sp. KM1]
MRYYELLYIVRPTMGEDELKAFINGVKERIEAEGGEILKNEVWQKRNLAYPIKKFKQGYYILVHYRSEAEVPKKIEEYLRIKEDVLRFLTTYMLKKDIKAYQKKEDDGKSE